MKRLPVIVELLICVTLFIIIPTSLIIYNLNKVIVNYTENEIAKSTISNLSSAETIASMYQDNVYKEAIKYSLIEDLEKIRQLKYYELISNTSDNIVIINGIYNNLKKYAYSNSSLHSIYFYPKNSDYFINTLDGIQQTDTYIDQEWLHIYHELLEDKTKNYWNPRRIYYDAVNSRTDEHNYTEIMSFFYLLTPVSSSIEGVIVINIYLSDIESIINSSDYSDYGKIYIIDSNANIVMHFDEKMLHKNISDNKTINQILSSKNDEGFYMKENESDNERIIYSYKKSSFNDWIFISKNSMDQLTSQINGFQFLAIISTILIILLGAAAIVLVSYKIYLPVMKLAKIYREKENDVSDIRNEAILVTDMFEKMSLRHIDMKKMVENSKKNLKTLYLTELLKGNINTSEDEKQQVEFKFNEFIVVLAYIDERNKLTEVTTSEERNEISSFFEEFWVQEQNDKLNIHVVDFDWGVKALIFNLCSYDSIKTIQTIKEKLQRCQKMLYAQIDATISFGIGTCHVGLDGISTSYSEGQRALKRKIIEGKQSIILWHKEYEEQSMFFYPYHLEKHILNYLSTNDLAAIKSTICDLNDEIRKHSKIKYDNVLQIYNQLVGATVKYLIDSNINASDILEYNIYNKLSQQETLEEIKLLLFEFYEHICLYIQPTNKNTDYSDKILQYFHNNFKKEINFEDLAAEIGISYSYLRKIVHEKIGKSSQDYVNLLRIEEAKRLLRNTNMSITDISQEIGFSNVQSLYRFFKKFNGITPGKFRDLG